MFCTRSCRTSASGESARPSSTTPPRVSESIYGAPSAPCVATAPHSSRRLVTAASTQYFSMFAHCVQTKQIGICLMCMQYEHTKQRTNFGQYLSACSHITSNNTNRRLSDVCAIRTHETTYLKVLAAVPINHEVTSTDGATRHTPQFYFQLLSAWSLCATDDVHQGKGRPCLNF